MALILSSAAIHAYWNLMAKRLPGGSEAVWLFTLVAFIAYAPLAIIAIQVTEFRPDSRAWLFMIGTGAFQMVYFTVLRRGYVAGDLSVVYPLARGSGPLVAILIATIAIGERPSGLTVVGALTVAGGAVLLATRRTASSNLEQGIGYGLLTGFVIGCYTAWDGYAVGQIAIPAIVYDWAGRVGLMCWLTPVAWSRRASIPAVWAANTRDIIGIGILSSASYIMILTALSLSPISSIAPAREISIVVGAVLGIVILGEPARRRLPAAFIITVGVLIVAFGS